MPLLPRSEDLLHVFLCVVGGVGVLHTMIIRKRCFGMLVKRWQRP